MTRQSWGALDAGGIRNEQGHAKSDAVHLKQLHPRARVRVFRRAVRAGGYTFTVWVAVAQVPKGAK